MEQRKTYPLIDLARTNMSPREVEAIRGRIKAEDVGEMMEEDAAWLDAMGRVGPHQYGTPR